MGLVRRWLRRRRCSFGFDGCLGREKNFQVGKCGYVGNGSLSAGFYVEKGQMSGVEIEVNNG